MFFIIGWIVYGLIVGVIAKFLHPGEDAVGLLPTVGIGVAGSYIGGTINWMLGYGSGPFSTSGVVMGVVGGVVFCWLYRTYRFNNFFKNQGRIPGNK